jgi:hypothetical protein
MRSRGRSSGRSSRKRSISCAVRDITFVSCGAKKFTYLNIPRQCPSPSTKARLEERQRVGY